MAGESQYYNPIIEAMIATANFAKSKVDQEQKAKEHDIESKQRDQQLKQAQGQFDEEHKLNLKKHEIALESLALQKKMADFEAMGQRAKFFKEGQQFAREGGDPKAFLKGIGLDSFAQQQPQQPEAQSQLEGVGLGSMAPAPQMPPDPGFSSVRPEQIYDINQEAANLKKMSTAKSSGTAEGAYDTEVKLLGAKTEKEKELLKLRQDFERTENKLDRQSRLAIESMGNSARLKIAGMGGDGSTGKAMVMGGLLGRIKLDGSNPSERMALNSIMEMGGKPLDPKELEALRQSQQLSPIFEKLESFIPRLAKSKGMAAVQGAGLKIADKFGWPTDLQNDVNILRSQAVNIGRALEGMTGGRVLVMQMQTDLDSFASGGIDQEQMRKRINNLKDFYINKVDEMFLKGVPTSQRMLLYHDQGIMPGYVALAPKTHPEDSSATLDVIQSIKEGEPKYRRTKK